MGLISQELNEIIDMSDWKVFVVLFLFKFLHEMYLLFNKLKILESYSFSSKLLKFFQNCSFYVELHMIWMILNEFHFALWTAGHQFCMVGRRIRGEVVMK